MARLRLPVACSAASTMRTSDAVCINGRHRGNSTWSVYLKNTASAVEVGIAEREDVFMIRSCSLSSPLSRLCYADSGQAIYPISRQLDELCWEDARESRSKWRLQVGLVVWLCWKCSDAAFPL